jgi:hypothetical protein
LFVGILVVIRANRRIPKGLPFKHLRRFMRVSYALYMAATLLGVVVYVAAFVLKI